MSEQLDQSGRRAKIEKIAQALSTGGMSLILTPEQLYGTPVERTQPQPQSKLGRVIEAFATGGMSLFYPDEPEVEKSDINRLAP